MKVKNLFLHRDYFNKKGRPTKNGIIKIIEHCNMLYYENYKENYLFSDFLKEEELENYRIDLIEDGFRDYVGYINIRLAIEETKFSNKIIIHCIDDILKSGLRENIWIYEIEFNILEYFFHNLDISLANKNILKRIHELILYLEDAVKTLQSIDHKRFFHSKYEFLFDHPKTKQLTELFPQVAKFKY